MHYIGDKCEPSGHVDRLLQWLEGRMPDEEYFSLFPSVPPVTRPSLPPSGTAHGAGVTFVDEPHLSFVSPDDHTEFKAWLETTQDDHLSVDTETTGLNTWHDRIRMVQFGDKTQGWAIPYEADPVGRALVEWALNWCAGTGRPLSAHRMKFDSEFLQNAGHTVEAICQDGKAAAHLIDPTCSGLKEAAGRAWGEWAIEGERKLKAEYKRTKTTWATIPLDNPLYWYYAALDPVLESRLQALNEPIIVANYLDLYEMELDVSQALQRAETRGIRVDLDYCDEQYAILDAQVKEIEAEWDWINLGSGPQIATALEAGWGIELPLGPVSPKTKKQQRKTDEATLSQYAGNELVDVVLRHRDLSRNAETYFGAYLNLAIDGRIHTFIDTLGARTGRTSSRDPNLQNIPKRDAGDYVRRAFMASPGCTLVRADFAQIEYRIFASACGEPEMIDAILHGEDLHAVVARLVYDDPTITKEDHKREVAKNANFAEIYMAGIDQFSKTAGITKAAGKAFKKKYHKRFPRVKPFTDRVQRYAKDNGDAIESRFGRRIPVDYNRIYASVNYLIQTTAADVLKRAIQRVAQTKWDEYFVLTVHDDLTFDVPDELVSPLLEALPGLMEDREAFKVPLEVELSTGPRMG